MINQPDLERKQIRPGQVIQRVRSDTGLKLDLFVQPEILIYIERERVKIP
jgi:hypothetical protein